MSDSHYDVLVIGGGGSGGFTAATTAMKSGASVAMVESGRLGGLCILAGCMPSKSLLHGAARVFGGGEDGRAAYPGVLEHKRRTVEFLAGRREEAVAAKQAQGLVVIRGRAQFRDPHTVVVDGRVISADKIVVATGSREMVPPVPGLAEAGFLTSDTLMELPELPPSLVVLGGGTLAVELAQYLTRMGVAVSVIQRSDHLMSSEDPKVGEILAQVMAEEGATVLTGTDLSGVAKQGDEYAVSYQKSGEPAQAWAKALLLALGRRPNTEGLNLEAAGVETGKGDAVKVNRYMQTSQAHIFAAGDVVGGLQVVNLAVAQGEAAGHNCTHEEMREVKDRVVPRAVYTDPEYARVGLNRAEAEAAGLEFAEAAHDLGELGAAKTYLKPLKGFMAMRAAKADGRIIGAELLAPHASLMIHNVAVAMQLGGTPADIAEIPFAHPCLAEIVELTAGRLARKLEK